MRSKEINDVCARLVTVAKEMEAMGGIAEIAAGSIYAIAGLCVDNKGDHLRDILSVCVSKSKEMLNHE